MRDLCKECENVSTRTGFICEKDCHPGNNNKFFIKHDRFDPSKIVTGTEQRRRLAGQEAEQEKNTGTTAEAKHYQIGTVQPIEVMQNTMTKDQFIGYCLGNVIKYSQRMNHKGQMRSDAGKCKQYAEWLIYAIDNVQIVPGGK